MLKKATKEFENGGRRFVLRRPGFGGLGRLHRRLAAGLSDPLGGVNAPLLELHGTGIEMEAVLHEYLVEGPDEWRARDRAGKPASDERGRPLWDFEDVDPEELAPVGEEAVAFHRTFRGVDIRFRADARDERGGAQSVEAAPDAAGAR